jgi:predicted dehydrogenase
MDKINVGIIGCGRIADLHALGYEGNPEARIYAVCDTNPASAERRKAQWGAEKMYTSHMDLLEDPAVDAVEILVPHAVHERIMVDAAGAGRHIALQKPMTNDLASADRMLAAADAAGTVFRVTDNYVFYPPLALAKRMIENGEIGTPANLRIKFVGAGSGGWEVPDSAWEWRIYEAAAGRGFQTFDHGHHLWTTAWFLLGEAERVVAWIDSADGVLDCPSVIMWKYKDGTRYGMCEYCHCQNVTMPSRYYANDEWIEVTGSDGILIVHRCTGELVPGPAVSLFTARGWKHYADVDSDWAAGFRGATDNFVSAIRGETSPLLSGREGREILRFTLAIHESSRLRREICLAEMDSGPLA